MDKKELAFIFFSFLAMFITWKYFYSESQFDLILAFVCYYIAFFIVYVFDRPITLKDFLFYLLLSPFIILLLVITIPLVLLISIFQEIIFFIDNINLFGFDYTIKEVYKWKKY